MALPGRAMKWLWLVFWNPPAAFDWYEDGSDRVIDHGKVAADIVVGSFLFVVLRISAIKDVLPPIAWGIVLIAGAMGARVFMTFLRSRVVTASENVVIEEPIQRKIDNPDAP